jgi:demethylmenaquinone methyltransferase/2-methoxy-6-polyprenyl-1,4-benzoquinol methylase
MLRVVGLHHRYRWEAISVLNLQKGMTVLDVACGTGLNFPYLYEAVGAEGRIIAIDIAPGMLERAKRRVIQNRWHNFEFIQGDLCRSRLPKADAAAAFWCMISIPEYQIALENIVSSLVPGGTCSVLDFKLVQGFPGGLLNPIFRRICRLTHQDIDREPWRDMELLLANLQMREWRLGGMLLSNVYLAWGQKR